MVGDFLTWEFEAQSFDVIVSIAALHHMDTVAALDRMRQLLRPRGRLAILGMARSRYPGDLPRDAAAAVASRTKKLRTVGWRSPAPAVWPPPYGFMEWILATLIWMIWYLTRSAESVTTRAPDAEAADDALDP